MENYDEIESKRNSDEVAVDAFAAAMKAKMADARAKGRGGWEDPAQCTAADLSRMLRDHVDKGDPRDVANFCMMLHQRGEVIAAREPVGSDGYAKAVRDAKNEVYNSEPHVIATLAWLDRRAARYAKGLPVKKSPWPCSWCEEGQTECTMCEDGSHD